MPQTERDGIARWGKVHPKVKELVRSQQSGEFQGFHSAEYRFSVQEVARAIHNPLKLSDRRDHRETREVAVQIAEVRVHAKRVVAKPVAASTASRRGDPLEPSNGTPASSNSHATALGIPLLAPRTAHLRSAAPIQQLDHEERTRQQIRHDPRVDCPRRDARVKGQPGDYGTVHAEEQTPDEREPPAIDDSP